MNKKTIIGLISIICLLACVSASLIVMLRLNGKTEEVKMSDIEWYDENATEFTITTAKELYEVVELSNFYTFEGQTIKLGADIIVNEGNATEWNEKAPDKTWYPIKKFAGTFDGQGHTISGLYGVGIDVAMGMFSGSSAKATVKDFKLTNSYFETKGNVGVGSIVVDGGGTFSQIYSDAIIDCDGNNASGIASVMKYKTSISECWYDGSITLTGRSAAGIVDQVNTVTISVDHCLYTGDIYSSFNNGGARIGGLIGSLKGSGSNVTMTDSLSVGTVGAMQTSYLASVLGTAYASSSITIADTFGSMGTYAQAIGSSGNKGKFTGTPIEIAEKSLQGNEAYRWTSLDFEKYWTVVEDSTPMLRCFADAVVDTNGLEKAYDISWYNESTSEFTITTKEQLYGFYYLGTGKDFKEKTIKLGADIVLNEGKASDWGKTEPENVWYPICRNSAFAGTFDGQGHTISGMYTTGNTIGLFGKNSVKSTIKNLKVTNSYFKGEFQISSIVGQGCGTFDTIYSDAVLVAEANEKTTNANGGRECGGIIGQMNADSKITNCWFAGMIETDTYAGGLVGNCANVSFAVDNCLFSGVIKGRRDEARNNIGGLIGHVNGSIDTIETMDVTNCLSAGRIINQDKATRIGSFIGYINAYRTYNFKNAYATNECYSQRGIAPFAGLIGSQKLVGVQLQAESAYVGYGGCQVTLLDFDKYWVAKSKTTPELKSFSTGAKLNLKGVAKADISWYNESKNTYVLSDISDLLGFTLLANNTDFAGKTIQLAADVTLNSGNSSEWGNTAPAMMWTPVGQSRPFAGSFDGQGHTISGLYTKGNAVGLFGKTTADSKISNVQLANSYFTGEYQVGGIVGQGSGIFDSIYVQKDVHLAVVGEEASTNKNGGRECGGIVGQMNDNGQFTNCWFAGTIEADAYAGGMIGNLPKASLEMSNCLFSGTITGRKNGKNDHIGGFIGQVGGTEDTKEKLILKDCLSSGEILGEAQATRVGSVIGYINAYRTYELTNVYATNECYKQQDKVAFAGVAGKKKISTAQLQDKEKLTGVGGYRLTVLDFDNYWAVKTATTPELKKFSNADVADLSKEIRIDITWYTSGNYTLSDIGDLYGLAYLVNGGETFAGKTITLANDIDVNEGWVAGPSAPGREWTPIGNATTKVAFAGTLEGNGKKISGIYVDGGSSDYVGLFAYTDDAKIQNLRLTNSYIASTGKGIGSIIAYANGSTTLENVYSDAVLSVSGKVIGGLVAQVQNGTKDTSYIKNSCYAGTINHSNLAASTAMGGFVGTATHGTLNVQNGLFVGTMDCTYNGTATAVTAHVGGVIGNTQGSNVLKISNTLGAGILDLNGSAITMNGTGSVAGYLNSSTYTNVINIDNVYGISSFHSKVLGGYVPTKNGLEQRSQNTEETVNGAKETILEKLNGTQEKTYWVINGSPEEDRYTVLLDTFKDMFAYSEYVEGDGGESDDSGNEEDNLPYDISWLDDTVNNGSSEETPYILSDVKDLLGFAYLVNRSEEPMSFEGKFIQLNAHIDVNPGWTAGATAPTTVWKPIGNATTKFAGIFDGNGKTISGIYVDGQTTQYVGLFGYTDGATIKNLRLRNSYITSAAQGVGGIIAYANGATTMENVYCDATLVISNKVIGGLIAQVQNASGDVTMIKNSCYAGQMIHSNIVEKTAMGGFVGTATHGTLVIQNGLFVGEMDCTYTGTATALTAHIGGMVGNTQGNNVLNITNSLGAGVLTVEATTIPTMNGTGSIIGYINASTTTGIVDKDSVYGVSSFHSKPVGGMKNTNSLANRSKNTVEVVASSTDTLLTKLNGSQTDTYWVKNANAIEDRYTIVLKSFENILNGTEWLAQSEGTQTKPYKISSVLELYGLAYLVNRSEEPMNFDGKYIQLAADINMNPGWTAEATAPENVWTPIGNTTTKFAGIFDGNGKTISGIYVDGQSVAYVGFFAYTDDVTITNLRLVNSYFTSNTDGVASIVAYANAGITLENVYSDATLVVNGKTIGGLIALVQNGDSDISSIKNSCYAGEIVHSNLVASTAMGGFVGSGTNGQLDIQNCLYVGEMKCTYSGTATSIDARVGGLCGVTQGTNVINVTNSMGAGVLTVTGNSVTLNGTGSILGYMNAKTKTGVVSTSNVVGVSTFHSKPVGAIRSSYKLAQRLTASKETVSANATEILEALNSGQDKAYWVKNNSTTIDRHAIVLSDFQTYFIESNPGANQTVSIGILTMMKNGFQTLANMFG